MAWRQPSQTDSPVTDLRVRVVRLGSGGVSRRLMRWWLPPFITHGGWMDIASSNSTPDVTVLLQRAAAGDELATGELFPLVYEELRRLAAVHLVNERTNHTLQPTALVHEAYLRL